MSQVRLPIALAGLLTAGLLITGAAVPQTGWQLAAVATAEHRLDFTMAKWLDKAGTKKADVPGTFKSFTVELTRPVETLKTAADLQGLQARVIVDLASLDTANPTRNQNVLTHYFQVDRFAKAGVLFSDFRPQGAATASDVDVTARAELDLHGVSHPLALVALHVSRTARGGLRIQTRKPIAVRSADFGLPAQALMQVCGHQGLDEAAAVSVNLELLPWLR